MTAHEPSIIFTNTVSSELAIQIKKINPTGGIFVIGDTYTAPHIAAPLIAECDALKEAKLITVEAGDENKDITQLAHIWAELSQGGATRHSLIINVGGGVVTDMGGFAAATFKRGVRCINIPTTLLGAVDAAIGGKTAINFAGLKNEVGVFSNPVSVIVNAQYFATLPYDELSSGYAELLKHALLDCGNALMSAISFDLHKPDFEWLQELLEFSIMVKQKIVTEDPTEKGIRKALNLGHTAGHAFESFCIERGTPVPHGHAVAWGLVVDMVLSKMLLDFNSYTLHATSRYIADHYPVIPFQCTDYDRLIELMRHDKKNISTDKINFTLIKKPGQPVIDQEISTTDITAAIDIARDLFGC